MNKDLMTHDKLFTTFDEIDAAITKASSGDIDETISHYISMLKIYPEYALNKNDKELLLKSYEFIDFNLVKYLKNPKKEKLSDEFIKNSLIYKRKISEALMQL